MEPDFNQVADRLIGKRQFDPARALLEAAVREMPLGWKPCQEDQRSRRIAFWNQEEFLVYVGRRQAGLTKRVSWVPGSYSRAWYQLAVVAIEQEQFRDALFCLDCGLELEPDHPELWCEKGYLLGRLKRYQKAFECYVRAASARDWAPPSQIARALRGQGVQLVDLERLDEAEAVLELSLELEPDSEVARQELAYVQDLRRKREAEVEQIPWFLHSFVNPPQDALTIRLLALVEDLPPIPGPHTVGQEDYSRIFEAFIERGWRGFEEEFDRIVPRDRSDYAHVKRDLLREPLFNRKVHRRLAETVSGKKSAEEMFDEIQRERERKPQ